MPLYECEQCHVVENTALTNFWDAFINKKPKLCSECDPAIKKWHGKFPRITAADFLAKNPNNKINYPASPNATLVIGKFKLENQ